MNDENQSRTETSTSDHSVSAALLAGALAGLLGAASFAGCSSDDAAPVSADPDAGTYNNVVSSDPLSYDQLVERCNERGGFLQTTAACAGNNACRGFSYIEPTLTEHSCRGLNSCGPGASCVYLPEDSGKTGEDIYKNTGCASTCHAQFEPEFDDSVFTLYVRPATVSLEEAKTRFVSGPEARLHSIVAFGVTGTNPDGSAYATMPAYHTKLSRPEVERVVSYLRTIPTVPTNYEIFGDTTANDADAGTTPGADAGP